MIRVQDSGPFERWTRLEPWEGAGTDLPLAAASISAFCGALCRANRGCRSGAFPC